MALNFYHIASLDQIQATNLQRNFITASVGNASGLKAVALEDTNFQEWEVSNVIRTTANPPLTEIQKLFDLSGYPQPPVIAIMPVFSSSATEVTSCRLYQFETTNDFLANGWKIPAVDGNPIQPSKAPFVDLTQGVNTVSQNGGLVYYYDDLNSQNQILS